MTDELRWEQWRNANAEIQKPYGGSVHKHIVWYQGVDRRKAFLDGLSEGRKVEWHNLADNPRDYPMVEGMTIRVVTYSGDEYICETESYEPAEDEIGYGHSTIVLYCNGDPFDINDVEEWCEVPIAGQETIQ